MLNKSNEPIYKKCLFPLYAALIGSIWSYVWKTNQGFYNVILAVITIGLFFYAMFNIKKMVDSQIVMKVSCYILVFTIVLQLSVYAVSIVFQGIIAFFVAMILLIGFWEIVTS